MSENSGKFITLNNNQHCSFHNAYSEKDNYMEMSERELNTFDKFIYNNSVNLNQVENIDSNVDLIYLNKGLNINSRYEELNNRDEINNSNPEINNKFNETDCHSFKLKENHSKIETENSNRQLEVKTYSQSNFKKTNTSNQNININKSSKDHLLFKLNSLNEVMEKNKELLLSKYKLKTVFDREHEKSKNLKNTINIINSEIERLKSENEAMVFAKFNEDLDRNNYQESQKKITVYCNDMKRKSMNVEKTYEDYENLIKQRQIENIEIENEYKRYIERAGKIY